MKAQWKTEHRMKTRQKREPTRKRDEKWSIPHPPPAFLTTRVWSLQPVPVWASTAGPCPVSRSQPQPRPAQDPSSQQHSSPGASPTRFRAEETRPIQVLIPTRGKTGTSPLDFSTFYSCICTAIFYNAVMQFRHSQTLSPE